MKYLTLDKSVTNMLFQCQTRFYLVPEGSNTITVIKPHSDPVSFTFVPQKNRKVHRSQAELIFMLKSCDGVSQIEEEVNITLLG